MLFCLCSVGNKNVSASYKNVKTVYKEKKSINERKIKVMLLDIILYCRENKLNLLPVGS